MKPTGFVSFWYGTNSQNFCQSLNKFMTVKTFFSRIKIIDHGFFYWNIVCLIRMNIFYFIFRQILNKFCSYFKYKIVFFYLAPNFVLTRFYIWLDKSTVLKTIWWKKINDCSPSLFSLSPSSSPPPTHTHSHHVSVCMVVVWNDPSPPQLRCCRYQTPWCQKSMSPGALSASSTPSVNIVILCTSHHTKQFYINLSWFHISIVAC